MSPLKHVWVTSEYEGVTKDLVHALKFSRASAAAETIAELLDSALPHYKDETIITYLPTANVRARQRGYDQSRLIAKAFANKRQLRFKETLARLGKTRQVGAKRDKRIEQVKNSYVSARPLNGLRVLLIDDVVTTGASLEAAAKVLRQAGAKEVNAAVFARAN